MQWRIAGSAPGTACTMDSSQSRRPPSSRIRRNQYDAAGALGCARRRSDVTRFSDMPLYGLLWKYDIIHKLEIHNI